MVADWAPVRINQSLEWLVPQRNFAEISGQPTLSGFKAWVTPAFDPFFHCLRTDFHNPFELPHALILSY
jgi:hypothetical protein